MRIIAVRPYLGILLGLAFSVVVSACMVDDQPYDLVIANARIIDPETRYDAIGYVGVRDGQIAEISDQPLDAEHIIDATGHVLAPGFIDVHTHSPTPLAARFAVLDGVTTQLDLEAGAYPVREYGFMFADGAPINYGASVSHLAIRIKVIEGRDQAYLFTAKGGVMPGPAMTEIATAQQIEDMRGLLEDGLRAGGLGIGLLLDYISGAVSDAELRMVLEVAGQYKVPVAVHVRRGLPGDPTGLREIIALAEETGAPVMICHIAHSAMQAVGDWLAEIDAANARGANIVVDNLGYAAGGTAIGADVFNRDWQKIFNISYGDVQWTETGEWLTEARWNHYRKTNPAGMINHHYVKEQWMETALSWPRTMVSTDVTPSFSTDKLTNPNIAGTFSRLIGTYARDRGLMDLSQALTRTSLNQALWLETAAPEFAQKGRIQIGTDADLVIFDPNIINSQADYGDPYQASRGIHYVVVAGEIVVAEGKIRAGVLPGQRIGNPN